MVFEEGKLANATTVGGRDADDPVVAMGELTLPGSGFTLPVPDRLTAALAGKVGKHVVLGLRPEHFGLRAEDVPSREGSGRASIGVVANVIEPLGNDMDVYMSTPLHEHVVGRVPARQGVEFGKKIDVVVDLDRAYFFEPGPTGVNLGLNGGVDGGVNGPAGVSAGGVNGSTAGANAAAGTTELTPAVA